MPDILIIPECENPEKLHSDPEFKRPNSAVWYGQNKHKGLGVFAYGNLKLRLLPSHNTLHQIILPISVRGIDKDFLLFAIWANNPKDSKYQYIGQVWKALLEYTPLMKNKSVILVGDFNSNTIWDKPRRIYNHSLVVDMLDSMNIKSAYHLYYKQTQGKEKHPTLYLYRHEEKAYHIDYCFASPDFTKRLKKVIVGDFKTWSALSDHTPLIVEFED
jgi:exonuclease III